MYHIRCYKVYKVCPVLEIKIFVDGVYCYISSTPVNTQVGMVMQNGHGQRYYALFYNTSLYTSN